jgi:hypothetical protein
MPLRRYRRESEVDGLAAATAAVYLGEFVVGAGEADLESFDLAQPAFAFGFGDAGGGVVADLGDVGSLGRFWPNTRDFRCLSTSGVLL